MTPSHPNVLFLQPLKTSEILRLCDIFRGCRSRTFGWDGVLTWNGLKQWLSKLSINHKAQCSEFSLKVTFNTDLWKTRPIWKNVAIWNFPTAGKDLVSLWISTVSIFRCGFLSFLTPFLVLVLPPTCLLSSYLFEIFKIALKVLEQERP